MSIFIGEFCKQLLNVVIKYNRDVLKYRDFNVGTLFAITHDAQWQWCNGMLPRLFRLANVWGRIHQET